MRTMILSLVLVLFVGCGSSAQRHTTPQPYADLPANLEIGQTVEQAEDACGWFLDTVEQLADGREARHYHFSQGSAALGMLAAFRAPQRRVIYFRAGRLESVAKL